MTLVNSEVSELKLIFCGNLFIRSGEDKESLKKAALATGGFIKKYGVDISEFDPKTGLVKKWKMKKNWFSVWKPLPKEEGVNFSGRRLRSNKKF